MAVEQKDRVAQGRALWQLGSVLGDQGQFKNAEVPLRDALAILESELGSDHLDIAKACNGTQAVGCPFCNMLLISPFSVGYLDMLLMHMLLMLTMATCSLQSLPHQAFGYPVPDQQAQSHKPHMPEVLFCMQLLVRWIM